jgi:uncharacterized protein with PQ loop repeat
MTTERLILHIFCVILGYAGSFMFAVCNVPAILKIKRTKSVHGVSLGWIALSTAANICCGLFVLDSNLISGVWQYPLYGNYGFALFCCIWLIKLYRKYKEPNKTQK